MFLLCWIFFSLRYDVNHSHICGSRKTFNVQNDFESFRRVSQIILFMKFFSCTPIMFEITKKIANFFFEKVLCISTIDACSANFSLQEQSRCLSENGKKNQLFITAVKSSRFVLVYTGQSPITGHYT